MIGRAWRAWRHWRRSRPFWGGLLVLLAAAEILVTERVPLRVILHLGPEGIAGYLLPIVMAVCGFLLWFNPQQRLFYSILAVLLSLGTWITSNLGGFILGRRLARLRLDAARAGRELAGPRRRLGLQDPDPHPLRRPAGRLDGMPTR
jgi:drug/metabolite transporter (DMT)-like permease